MSRKKKVVEVEAKEVVVETILDVVKPVETKEAEEVKVEEVKTETEEEIKEEEEVKEDTVSAGEVKEKETVVLVNFSRRSNFSYLNGQEAKVLFINKAEAIVETSTGKFIVSLNNIKR